MKLPSFLPVPGCCLFIRTWFIACLLCITGVVFGQGKIDRQAVVSRHNITIQAADSLASLSVGNGAFAFTADVTGLQSFPERYAKGVPLGTQSEWGWHSFPNDAGYRVEESYKPYQLEGKTIRYNVQWKTPERNREASEYFRISRHRLQLGNIGLELFKKDGSKAGLSDIRDIHQTLDLWKGRITSRFTLEGIPVQVITYAHQEQDAVAANITSPLLAAGRLKITLRFPYPTGEFTDEGVNYGSANRHVSRIEQSGSGSALISHTLDTTSYFVHAGWNGKAVMQKKAEHEFTVSPAPADSFQICMLFTPGRKTAALPTLTTTRASSINGWKKFWLSGGAVDFAGSTDPRAMELERRVVLSQYLTRVQSAGHNPPQETGLTYNSWYGKPHMEMFWWHAAHFALWNRTDLLEKSMDWYFRAAAGAKAIAQRQGFDGVRWQKMTDNDGNESPSSVGAFLIWQQPHFIYLAELIYRSHRNAAVLQKYKDLLFATADFMASFPTYDKGKDRYNLGRGLIPAQECFDASATYNPTYELAYWYWALNTAQEWRRRLGMPRKKSWDNILQKLAPLPVKNGVYLATESTPHCYDADSKYTIDHPAVLAALSTIPAVHRLDTATMRRTYELVGKVWHWDHTWGWDYPLIAMTATRLNQPEAALDVLFMNVQKNTYLVNGHNYQDERLRIYLPGNGGLLSAVALMCAGYDGCGITNPGFPKNGTWKVRWEGLNRMP